MKQTINVIVQEGGQTAKLEQKEFEIYEAFGKKYPHVSLGIKFWHLLPNKTYKAEILDNGKIKII